MEELFEKAEYHLGEARKLIYDIMHELKKAKRKL